MAPRYDARCLCFISLRPCAKCSSCRHYKRMSILLISTSYSFMKRCTSLMVPRNSDTVETTNLKSQVVFKLILLALHFCCQIFIQNTQKRKVAKALRCHRGVGLFIIICQSQSSGHRCWVRQGLRLEKIIARNLGCFCFSHPLLGILVKAGCRVIGSNRNCIDKIITNITNFNSKTRVLH